MAIYDTDIFCRYFQKLRVHNNNYNMLKNQSLICKNIMPKIQKIHL